MIDREENEILTRTGAGTLMGDLFRRYWLPALLSAEVAKPDCPPVRVTLLGEPLICFRDSNGKIGLIDEVVAPRGVPLWVGRNAKRRLRRAYHSWKFAITGQ